MTLPKSRRISYAFSTLLFIICLTFVIYRSKDCFEKYLNRLESVEVKYVNSKSEAFPSFSFCQRRMNPGLNECNLTWIDYRQNLKWRGNCSNPQKARKAFLMQTENYLKTLKINHVEYPQNHSYFKWSTNLRPQARFVEPCLDLAIVNFTNEPIENIQFYFEKNPFFVSIGTFGSFSTEMPSSRSVIQLEKSLFTYVNFEVVKIIDYSGKPCSVDPEYRLDYCKSNLIENEIEAKVGCHTPFGRKWQNICTDEERAKEAMQMYQKLWSAQSKLEGCLVPCTFHR